MSNITRAERLAARLHDEATSESGAVKFTTSMLCCDELRRLAESERALMEALDRLEKEFRRVFPIYYYAEPWAHDTNPELRLAQQLIATTKEARNG